jgi:hypothetical protein
MEPIYQTRLVTALDCELSKEPLDTKHVGYQEPEPMETRAIAGKYNQANKKPKPATTTKASKQNSSESEEEEEEIEKPRENDDLKTKTRRTAPPK